MTTAREISLVLDRFKLDLLVRKKHNRIESKVILLKVKAKL